MWAWIPRHPFLAFWVMLAVSLAVLYGWGSIEDYMMTPEQRAAVLLREKEYAARQELASQAQAAVDAKAHQAQAALDAEKRALCHSERLCRDFGRARQECAVAGNFDTCIQIKMGANASAIYNCTEGGKLRGGGPAWDECLLLSPLEALRGY